MTHPSRVSGTTTLPGGIQIMGPLLRIPGRQLCADPADLDEAEQHADSVKAAVAMLRAEYPRG